MVKLEFKKIGTKVKAVHPSSEPSAEGRPPRGSLLTVPDKLVSFHNGLDFLMPNKGEYKMCNIVNVYKGKYKVCNIVNVYKGEYKTCNIVNVCNNLESTSESMVKYSHLPASVGDGFHAFYEQPKLKQGKVSMCSV